MSINDANKIDVKSSALAGQRVIKVINNGVAEYLPVGLSSLNPNGGAGDSTVKFGYWTADGKFQEVDLSGDAPVDSGEPVAVNAVMFDTGKDVPDYGGGTATAIEFYECASYTPNTDAYTEYSFTLIEAADENANGKYVRIKYIETPDPDIYQYTATWQNSNGYKLTEYSEYGEVFTYEIKDGSGNNVYYIDNPIYSRLTDFNSTYWCDADNYEAVDLGFSAIQTEEIPATTESWSGYKVTQNSETGAWSKTDNLVEDMQVGYLKPKVGEIYSADTSIRVRKMYDGAVYPITSDGLVFYAALEENYVDKVSGTTATVTGGTFTTHNGLRCLEMDGLEYVQWPDNADLPAGDVPYSFVVMAAPTNNYDWKCYASIGYVGSDEIAIHAKNGRLEDDLGSTTMNSDGTWYALALTRDTSGGAKTYLNGKFEGSGNRTNSVPSPAHVCVGAQANSFSQIFKGYIAFVAIYNRELSADEVAEIHSTLMADVEQ